MQVMLIKENSAHTPSDDPIVSLLLTQVPINKLFHVA